MPKGDAEKLRADIDDGYARISWLLLEALSCAPLTATEHAIIWCLVRRTYGWAKSGDRSTGKMTAITAAELARCTNKPRRTIEDAIANLVRTHVLIRELVAADNRCAYGINSDVQQWGGPGPIWASWYVCLQEAQQHGTYTEQPVQVYGTTRTGVRNAADRCTEQPVQVYGTTRTGVRNAADRCTEQPVYPPPTNPRAPGVSDPPTTSLTTSLTENVNDLAIPAECATLDSQAEDPCEGQGTPTHKARSETPEQAAIHRLWDAFELPGNPSPSKGDKPGYASVLLLVQTHGIPLLDQLSAHVTADPTARLPDGAKPWPWFCKQARAYMAAPWKWAQAADHRTPPRSHEEFILLNDGTTCPASQWDYTQRWQVGEMKAADNWDASTGRTKRPTPGYTCIDGRFYPPQSDPVTL